jgi:hypothetical protein
MLPGASSMQPRQASMLEPWLCVAKATEEREQLAASSSGTPVLMTVPSAKCEVTYYIKHSNMLLHSLSNRPGSAPTCGLDAVSRRAGTAVVATDSRPGASIAGDVWLDATHRTVAMGTYSVTLAAGSKPVTR